MTTYKAGDKVKCIVAEEGSKPRFTKNNIYTVIEDFPLDRNEYWVRVEKDDYGKQNGLPVGMFVLYGTNKTELEVWHEEFPYLVSHIREVMRHD